MRNVIIILVLGLILISCAKEGPSGPPINGNTPFQPWAILGGSQIVVPDYFYQDDITGKSYFIHGMYRISDTLSNYLDTVSARPTLIWEKTNSRYVLVAIFNRRIRVSNNRISNPGDIVWIWDTGIPKGQEGTVLFNEGCNVVNGAIQYNVTPTPLMADSNYVWAVWAWDDKAQNITHSSREIPIHIEK